jgi:hypothetical protein
MCYYIYDDTHLPGWVHPCLVEVSHRRRHLLFKNCLPSGRTTPTTAWGITQHVVRVESMLIALFRHPDRAMRAWAACMTLALLRWQHAQ